MQRTKLHKSNNSNGISMRVGSIPLAYILVLFSEKALNDIQSVGMIEDRAIVSMLFICKNIRYLLCNTYQGFENYVIYTHRTESGVKIRPNTNSLNNMVLKVFLTIHR